MAADKSQAMEERIAELAAHFDYPNTPDLRQEVGAALARPSRGWLRPGAAWAAAAALVVAVVTLSLVPAARASLGEIVRIGAVRLGFGPSVEQELAEAPGVALVEIDFGGETSLELAREAFARPILLPAYPPALGEPDRVFVQQSIPGEGVALVWLNENGTVKLAVFELTGDPFLTKLQPNVIEQTTVGGAQAYWTQGPYLVEIDGGSVEQRRLIDGHVLIWEAGGVTYRLETHLSLAEARRIAESLQAP